MDSEVLIKLQTLKIINGGRGASKVFSDVSSRLELPTNNGLQLLIVNPSNYWLYLYFLTGDSGTAVVGDFPMAPGEKWVGTIEGEGKLAEFNDGIYTYVAGICEAGQTARGIFIRSSGF